MQELMAAAAAAALLLALAALLPTCGAVFGPTGTSPVGNAQHQSTFAPEAFTTCAHLAVSAAINRVNSAGVMPLGLAP
jgi:hypothetical protein